MNKNLLLRTNILVCVIITIGFLITALISYKTNWEVFEHDVEQVSNLTMESVSHQIDSNFTKPVHISLTMANDSLLKSFLSNEAEHLNDEAFIKTMREYLDAYRTEYGYNSVFLVSTRTNRYYHFNGLDRTLVQGNPENEWYYNFLSANEEYSLNIDNDEASKNEITVFVNAKISSSDGKTLGVVGVGFQVDTLQALLREYENTFNIHAYLVNSSGEIEISTDRTGYQTANLFEEKRFSSLKDKVLGEKTERQAFWFNAQEGKGYLVSQYMPSLEWYLIIDHDTADVSRQLNLLLLGAVAIIVFVVVLVLLIITSIIRKYNRKAVELTIAQEQEHQAAFVKATEQMYENIYELDITHDRAASEATEAYFEGLGAPKGTPYHEALKIVAQKQIKTGYKE